MYCSISLYIYIYIRLFFSIFITRNDEFRLVTFAFNKVMGKHLYGNRVAGEWNCQVKP